MDKNYQETAGFERGLKRSILIVESAIDAHKLQISRLDGPGQQAQAGNLVAGIASLVLAKSLIERELNA